MEHDIENVEFTPEGLEKLSSLLSPVLGGMTDEQRKALILGTVAAVIRA